MNLPRDLKALVNRRAHAAGIQYSEVIKARLLAAIEAQRASGATPAQLLAMVESAKL